MNATCTRCMGAGTVPVYAHHGTAPCPRCSAAPSPLDEVRDVVVAECEAILVVPGEPARVIADPHAVRVAGARATWERVDALTLVLASCEEHGITLSDWLRRAREALQARAAS